MATQELASLARRLEAHAPASMLAIGPQAGALLARYQSAHPECAVTYLDPHGTLDGEALLRELESRGRYDFVVLRGVLERTDESLSGGWFHSGDLGVMHPDNYIQLKDRSKDIIISGGENISSIEVEDTLYRQ